jgi:hypothetical protein
MRRRRPTLWERTTPCECCGHPLSQRHHLLPVPVWGDKSATVALCPNCHEILHLLRAWHLDHSPRAGAVLSALHPRKDLLAGAQYLWAKVAVALELEAALRGLSGCGRVTCYIPDGGGVLTARQFPGE